MQKTLKRTLALLLAALLAFSSTIAASAAPETQTPTLQTQYGLDSTDTVGALLGNAVTELSLIHI